MLYKCIQIDLLWILRQHSDAVLISKHEGGGGGRPEPGHVSEQEALSGLCLTDS